MQLKNNKIKALLSIIAVALVISAAYIIIITNQPEEKEPIIEKPVKEIDDRISPDINQAVSLSINRIHKIGIKEVMDKIGTSWKKSPSFHFEALLDTGLWEGNQINSWDTGYVGWEAFRFVENEMEECTVEIKIFEQKKQLFRTADQEVESMKVIYDFRTGRWSGDDNFNDSDGYGHYVGDNYEIWFDIHNSDKDGDGIPYWTEVNILGTNPNVDDSIKDPDNDGIPTYWEWKWGYDPMTADNHSELDPDIDGITNIDEYKLEKYLANPHHKEIYIESDFMEKEPGLFGHEHIFWKESQWMLMDEFIPHDITVHIDDGCMGGGGEYLPFFESYIDQASGKGSEYYKYHFADDRKGVFRYCVILHAAGWAHPQDYKIRYDVISVPSNNKFYRTVFFPPALTGRTQRISMAVGVMHELGHTLGINDDVIAGCDNHTQIGRGMDGIPALQKQKMMKAAKDYWNDYQSCMNYAWFGKSYLGYSDGTNGPHDFDDWSFIDLTFFKTGSYQKEGVAGSDSPPVDH